MNPTVFDCTIITLPRIKDRRGNLTPIHNSVEIPFDIKRVFYLFDIPGGENRGAHAHRRCHQFLIAASGSFEVLVNDGRTQRLIQLNRPYLGLHIPPMIWASEINFSSGAICLVLASEMYSEFDYVRDYERFLTYIDILFVPYTTDFLDLSWIWLNDPEIKDLTDTPDFTKEIQLKWFEDLKNRSDYRVWGIVYKGEKIGVAGLKNISNLNAEYFGYIGEKKFWNKGISRCIFDHICSYARESNIKDISLRVKKNNLRAINAYSKYGFKTYQEKENELMMHLKIYESNKV